MRNLFLVLLICLPFMTKAQDCNKLGVWMWYLEITGFDTHEELADSLSNMHIKRIYLKVADGTINTTIWPELIDTSIIDAYHNAGMEVWAWSYNYPNNSDAQAEALYMAAQTGYDGFVIDVEMQFDNKPQETEDLFTAFYNAREQAILDNLITEDFKIYCTTWGNPKDHQFSIDKIDPYVDGYMPQTYVEIWGQSYLDNITYWVEEGNREYEELGATKPIHHIAAMESGKMTGEQVNEFIAASGEETSIWRIPGGGTPLSIWDDWNIIDWEYDFCGPTASSDLDKNEVVIYPNPASDYINLMSTDDIENLVITNMDGNVLIHTNGNQNQLDISTLVSGIYNLQVLSSGNWSNHRLVVLHQ